MLKNENEVRENYERLSNKHKEKMMKLRIDLKNARKIISELEKEQCIKLAENILRLNSANEVEKKLKEFMGVI